MISQISIGKRTLIGILLVGVPILIVWGVILILPWFAEDHSLDYSLKITLISDSEDAIENPVNLTISEVESVPVLHGVLEEILLNESVSAILRFISKEEAIPLTSLFESKGFPLTRYRQFYYKEALFGIDYFVSS